MNSTNLNILFDQIQAGPIERLVFPTEGEGEEKKHKGHAYIVFKHPESVQYSTQVWPSVI